MILDVLTGGPAELVVVVDTVADREVVVAAGFRDPAFIGQLAQADATIEPGELPSVRRIWSDYLAGDVHALERAEVRQSGSPVQQDVWDMLREIKPGEPLSYSEVAALIGRPRAARAVGSACGANHVAPFVPCHRVVAANGGLGGYGYGLAVKQWLLDHESRAC